MSWIKDILTSDFLGKKAAIPIMHMMTRTETKTAPITFERHDLNNYDTSQ